MQGILHDGLLDRLLDVLHDGLLDRLLDVLHDKSSDRLLDVLLDGWISLDELQDDYRMY
jgi:hypothetical protein